MASHLPFTVFPLFFYHVPHCRNIQKIILACKVVWSATQRSQDVLFSNQKPNQLVHRVSMVHIILYCHDRASQLQALLSMFSSGCAPFSISWCHLSSFCFLCIGMWQKIPWKPGIARSKWTLLLWEGGEERDKGETKMLDKKIYKKSPSHVQKEQEYVNIRWAFIHFSMGSLQIKCCPHP